MKKLTREEVAAMWLDGDRYAYQSLGIIDYYANLSPAEKALIGQMLRELDAARPNPRRKPRL